MKLLCRTIGTILHFFVGNFGRFCLSMVALLLCLLAWLVAHEISLNHRGYEAWVKQTGNAKALTYDEWYALKETTNMWRNDCSSR